MGVRLIFYIFFILQTVDYNISQNADRSKSLQILKDNKAETLDESANCCDNDLKTAKSFELFSILFFEIGCAFLARHHG